MIENQKCLTLPEESAKDESSPREVMPNVDFRGELEAGDRRDFQSESVQSRTSRPDDTQEYFPTTIKKKHTHTQRPSHSGKTYKTPLLSWGAKGSRVKVFFFNDKRSKTTKNQESFFA